MCPDRPLLSHFVLSPQYSGNPHGCWILGGKCPRSLSKSLYIIYIRECVYACAQAFAFAFKLWLWLVVCWIVSWTLFQKT